jgi:hypothetical protein
MLYIELVCVSVLAIHLTDVDTALKIAASISVLLVNTAVVYNKIKSKSKSKK